MAELPAGTLTFLFTDLEGSTALWEADADVMREAVARHDELLADSVVANGGAVVKTTGDGLVAVFAAASDGVAAALACQRALGAEPWAVPLKARMGLYTGEATPFDGDYHAPVLNRAARVMAAGHGGQVLLSATTAGLVRSDFALVDLGEHRLRDLGRPEVLHQLIDPDLERRFPRLRTLDAYPGNLPLQVSSFVGREDEVRRGIGALAAHRLVTLTGVGGVGKTRLACQVAAEALPRFREGAWLVELAPVRDPKNIVATIAADIGMTLAPDSTEALVEFFGTKRLLLVLDNCEHLLDAVADVAEAIERSCPHVSILATSREPLAVEGELVLGVPSLSAAASRALFAERATAGAPTRGVDPDDDGVDRVCERLDGIPLAIELAAARTRAVSPARLADRLDDVFAVLAGGRRGAVERHQTLRSAIDWSYELLSPDEQRLLARLSVFSGGWTLEDAEAVCGDAPLTSGAVFDLHEALVMRSMVVAEPARDDFRYRLLETIRQYAEERLAEAGESQVLRERHALHYAAFAESWAQDGLGADQLWWARRLDAERDNLANAGAFAVEAGMADSGLRLTQAGLWWGYQIGPSPLLDHEAILALRGAAEHPMYPWATVAAAFAASRARQFERALELARQARDSSEHLDLALRTEIEGLAEFATSQAWMQTGDFGRCLQHHRRAVELARATGDERLYAAALYGLAALEATSGNAELGVALAEEALAIHQKHRAPISINCSKATLALALAFIDPARASALLSEALADADREGFVPVVALVNGPPVPMLAGDTKLALEIVLRGIPLMVRSADFGNLGLQFLAAAQALAANHPEAAAIVLGAARAQFRRGQAIAPPASEPASEQRPNHFGQAQTLLRSALIEALGDQRMRQFRTRGEQMTYDDAVAYALDQTEGALGEIADQETGDNQTSGNGETG